MISGEKVYIRGITKDDANDIYKWVNREELRDLTGTLFPVSEYEHENWMKSILANSDKKLFMIIDKQKNISLGTIGLKNFDNINRNVELFISIGNELPEFKGQGYGTDAVKTLVKYCFDRLNMHKVYLNVFESNVRAIRCYEKAGFKEEGILVEHRYLKGKYENVIIMGITNSI